jgi:hypothetical protein
MEKLLSGFVWRGRKEACHMKKKMAVGVSLTQVQRAGNPQLVGRKLPEVLTCELAEGISRSSTEARGSTTCRKELSCSKFVSCGGCIHTQA